MLFNNMAINYISYIYMVFYPVCNINMLLYALLHYSQLTTVYLKQLLNLST